MPRVVITSASGQGNVGDDAIAAAEILALQQAGISDLLLLSPRPEEAAKVQSVVTRPGITALYRNTSVPRWSWQLSRLHFLKFVGTMLLNARRIARGKGVLLLSAEQERYLRDMASADVFMVAGGGVFCDGFRLEMYIAEILIAKALGKPCFLGAQTVGPLSRRVDRFFLKRALRNTFVTVRDTNISKPFLLSDVGLRDTPVYEGVDDAFMLPGAPAGRAAVLLEQEGVDVEKVRRAHEIVCLNTRTCWLVAGQKRPETGFLIKMLRWLVSRDCFIIFVPTSKGDFLYENADPRKLLLKDAGLTDYPHLRVLDRLYGVSDTKSILGAADFAMGMAFHFNVFALSEGIPVVGLYRGEYYRRKLLGAHQGFEDGRFVVDVTAREFEQVAGLVEECIRYDRGVMRRNAENLLGRCGCAVREIAALMSCVGSANMVKKVHCAADKSVW